MKVYGFEDGNELTEFQDVVCGVNIVCGEKGEKYVQILETCQMLYKRRRCGGCCRNYSDNSGPYRTCRYLQRSAYKSCKQTFI